MRRFAGVHPARTIGLFLVACLALAACGSSDFSTANSPTSPSAPVQPSPDDPPDDPGDARRREYIDAATEGIASPGVSATEARCFATEIVDGLGVARMEDAGILPGDLTGTSFNFPLGFGATVPDETKARLGAGLQQCGFSRLAVESLIAGTGQPDLDVDGEGRACAMGEFDAAGSRVLVANVLLGIDSEEDAIAAATVFLDCFSYGRLVSLVTGVALGTDEIACIDRSSRTSSAIRQVMGALVIGKTPTNAQATRVGVEIRQCVTPEHARQLTESQSGLVS